MRKHPLADCENCPLAGPENIFVPSDGPEKAELAFVGEAPGGYEAQTGKPFMGPSGQLLMQITKNYGYQRKDVLFTNATLCRPPGNATPPAAAVAACRGRLVGELSGRESKFAVALGNTAAQVLLGSTMGITALRVGPPKRGDLLPDLEIIPTWHPAYVLRNADAFPALVRDIGKLKGEARAWNPPKWRAYEDPDEALQVLDALRERTDRVVVDIEVGIEKDTAFGHPNEYDLLCVGLAYAQGAAVVLGELALKDRRVLDRLGDLLRDTKVTAHNGKFDAAGLYRHVGDFDITYDTMLGSYCLDETAGGHSLGDLGIEVLGTPNWKYEIKKFMPRGGSYAQVPRPILYKYCAYDTCVTWDLEDYQVPLLEKYDLRRVHDFMVAAGNQLKFLEMNGITIDREYSDLLSIDYLSHLQDIEVVMAAVIGHELNPRSPQQVKEYLLQQGVRVESTNKDTLEQVQKRIDESSELGRFLVILLEHRRKQKLYSTYVKGIRKRMYAGRVYTTYLLHGTTSGRLSSRNPNLQNIVRDKAIKQQFTVAKPENVLMQVDYKQAEGRIICWLAQDEYLRGILSDPTRDLFDELTNDLRGEGTDLKDKDIRVRTKAYFYGMGYGRDAYSIAMEYGLPVREAEAGLAAFKRLIPATVEWQTRVRNEVLSGHDLISPFGRRRRYWLITEQNRKDVLNEALSFLPQSTASDICLSALVRLRPMLRGLAFIRLTIHDALVVEAREEDREEVAEVISKVMLEEANKLQDYVPFEVDVTFGKHWGEL